MSANQPAGERRGCRRLAVEGEHARKSENSRLRVCWAASCGERRERGKGNGLEK